MKVFYVIMAIGFVLLISGSPTQEYDSPDRVETVTDTVQGELTAQEWKRFERFEKDLRQSATSQQEKASLLKNYTRDSLKILEVKLMAVKLLEAKNLLKQDIVQNTQFYFDLLNELEASKVNPSNYSFLKDKLLLFRQRKMQYQLRRSQWLNVGLGILVLLFVGRALIRLKRAKKPTVQELSRQETTIRDLIIQGKSNKEIASELFISLSTVKTHITNIYSKLQVSNRQELVHKIQN